MPDLSKLHPIHQEAYAQAATSPHVPPEALAKLYEVYLDLNETVPDIIGKQEDDMTKSQKRRYAAKVEELDGLSVKVERKDDVLPTE